MREVMRAADHMVDLGPGAGERGGEVMFSRAAATRSASNGNELADRPLSERRIADSACRKQRRKVSASGRLRIIGARRAQPAEHRRRRFRWA